MLTLSRTRAALAALWLCLAAMPVHRADAGAALAVTPGVSGSPVLPAVSDPQPYRQMRIAACDKTLLGLANSCLIGLGRIPVHHVLRIDTINCGGLFPSIAGSVQLFDTNVQLDADHLVATFPSISDFVVASGPFYFKEGEVPRFVTVGQAPTDQAYCSVAGTLWTTN
jgi:hypothetical protein